MDRIASTLQDILKQLSAGLVTSPGSVVSQIGRDHLPFLQRMYSNSTADVENDGHTFGRSLSPGGQDAR